LGASFASPDLIAPVGEFCRRIVRIAPLTEAEQPVQLPTEELVVRGHDVTLFANRHSNTPAKLEPIWDLAILLHGSVRDPTRFWC
jgi:hypothetical protein